MPKLLIVDDEEATLDMLSTYLGLIGHETISAINGYDGLYKAQAENPDLMLLDLMMPDLQGYEVCSSLRTQSAYSSLPILIISARTDQGSIEKAMTSGADGYFTKPLDLRSLTQEIERLLANPPSHAVAEIAAATPPAPEEPATQAPEPTLLADKHTVFSSATTQPETPLEKEPTPVEKELTPAEKEPTPAEKEPTPADKTNADKPTSTADDNHATGKS